MATTILGTLKDGTQVTQIVGPIAVTGLVPGLTDAQLRASALPVSGTVSVTGSVACSGAFYPPTQPISGAVTATSVGSIAAAATDSGNPVKTGALYTALNPVYATGQRTNSRSNILGESLVRRRNWYSHITGNTPKLAKTGAGVLGTIILGTVASTSTITVYDGIDATGSIITIINPAGATTGTALQLDVEFNTGLFVVTAGFATNDVTLLYQ